MSSPEKSFFSSRCPTRVDLAGGTLDCWPLSQFVDRAMTINVAVSVFTGATLSPREDSELVEVAISEEGPFTRFSNLKEFLAAEDEFGLLRKHIEYWLPPTGFQLRTFSQCPVGGGLGASSSLSIALFKVFKSWFQKMGRDKGPRDLYGAVELVHNLEARLLRTPTGTQDYVPAWTGGLNFIDYSAEGMRVHTVEPESEILDEHMLLVYTGRPHNSGINNWQVIKAAVEGDQKVLAALNGIAKVTRELSDTLLSRRWSQIPYLLKREYESRILLTPAFLSPEIERVSELVLAQGAEAVKICGAGGGGCVLVWAGKNQKQKLRDLCLEAGYQVLDSRVVPLQTN